ncbi:hypothetical protein INT45_009080 [Circinella minor]|uniref:Uncharacterized protein n=1 Tax=Circinella minor TaxID=1195481 RepID=A0A8H7VG78_9FUNG|nr:hypothetical protein INT45_009080 [Circinella minor]
MIPNRRLTLGITWTNSHDSNVGRPPTFTTVATFLQLAMPLHLHYLWRNQMRANVIPAGLKHRVVDASLRSMLNQHHYSSLSSVTPWWVSSNASEWYPRWERIPPGAWDLLLSKKKIIPSTTLSSSTSITRSALFQWAHTLYLKKSVTISTTILCIIREQKVVSIPDALTKLAANPLKDWTTSDVDDAYRFTLSMATNVVRQANEHVFGDKEQVSSIVGRKIDVIMEHDELGLSASEWTVLLRNSITRIFESMHVCSYKYYDYLLMNLRNNDISILSMKWTGSERKLVSMKRYNDYFVATNIRDMYLPMTLDDITVVISIKHSLYYYIGSMNILSYEKQSVALYLDKED